MMQMIEKVIYISIPLIFTINGQIFLKRGLTSVQKDNSLSDGIWPFFLSTALSIEFLIGFFLAAIGFILWMVVLSKYEVTSLLPFAGGLAYIYLVAFSQFFLKESLSMQKLSGIILISIGIYVLNK